MIKMTEIYEWAIHATWALPAVMVAAALLVSSCTGTIPGVSQQGRAGITDVEVTFSESGEINGVRWVDGKEKADVALSATLPNGLTIDYSAKDVDAFPGQEVRGAVESAIAEQAGEVAPGVVDAVVGAVLQALSPAR